MPAGALQAAAAPASEGGLGSQTKYKLRFSPFSEDSVANRLRLATGMPAVGGIIADRAYNTKNTTNAFLGYDAISKVEYDPQNAPSTLTAMFRTIGPDMRPLPAQKIELYVNRIEAEGSQANSYFSSETFRQVLVGARRVEVTDFEILQNLVLHHDGSVHGRQRTVVYLQPQDALYFEVYNRGVAVYDYALTFKKELST